MAAERTVSVHKRQRGVALITVLVVIAIGTTLAAAMIWDSYLGKRRTANIIDSDQATAYAIGAEEWAGEILRRDREKNDTDNLGEIWATQLPPLPVDGGQIIGHIEDMQGRFNLNNLIGKDGKPDKQAVAEFRRLLAVLNIDPTIIPAIEDWIDPDFNPQFPNGAEDDYYLGLQPAYRAANRPMASITELRLVKGIDDKIYRQLSPYVTALPEAGTAINVNTASAPVIASLADGISEADAESFISARGEAGFKSIGDFSEVFGRSVPDGLVTVSSHYFLVTEQVTIGTITVTMYSLMSRADNGSTRPVFRSLGTL
jgi:general secretion pathway protein K